MQEKDKTQPGGGQGDLGKQGGDQIGKQGGSPDKDKVGGGMGQDKVGNTPDR